jgi:outer membrane protein TolC
MNLYKVVLLVFLLSCTFLQAQTSIDNALLSIEESNKTLIAAHQFVKAKNLELHTGIYPNNPFVSLDYMIGSPVAGGNQLDFLVTQEFDFPTVYFKNRNLANQKGEILIIQSKELRQSILLDAKITMLELIHLNKNVEIVKIRVATSAALVKNYQQKFEVNQISALQLNKAKIQLLNIQTKLRTILNGISVKTHHLTNLNGGNKLNIADTEYPLNSVIPNFKTLEDSIEAEDPELKILNQQIKINQANLRLNKAKIFPKLELGYHYQSVLGQTFNGAHFGISIPIWERKNTLKAAKAKIELGNIKVEEHKNQHYFEIKQLFEKYQNIKQTTDEYRQILNDLNSEEILNKSLELGEINFITYASEIRYYYEAYDTFLELNKECQIVLAQLFKYKL